MKLLVEKTKGIEDRQRPGLPDGIRPGHQQRTAAESLEVYEVAVGQGAAFLRRENSNVGAYRDTPLQNGFYLEPTILENVTNNMKVAQEEIRPVLAVMKFKDEQQAIAIANDSAYGLASCVRTKDPRPRPIAWPNSFSAARFGSTPTADFTNAASFGGYKQSGFRPRAGCRRVFAHMCKHVCIDQTPGGTPLVTSCVVLDADPTLLRGE